MVGVRFLMQGGVRHGAQRDSPRATVGDTKFSFCFGFLSFIFLKKKGPQGVIK